jgi:hypothetical protein
MVLPIPKFNYYRSKAHLKNVAELPCQHCGTEGQTQAAHSNWAKHGKGRGIKASDEFTAALCYSCHAELDQGMSLSREERKAMWDNAHAKTLVELEKRGLWIKY